MRTYLLLFILSTILTESETTAVDIKDAGVGFINEGDIALLFYITLDNRNTQDFDIFASMIQCCEIGRSQENDCNSMYLIGGNMGVLYSKTIKNITLIYPNLYLYNRQGVCTVDVKYQNENTAKEITTEIDFKTVKKRSIDLPNCSTVDLDPTQNCSPVDCVVKYSGEISYFNPKCNKCEGVATCMSNPEKCVPEIAYSIANNNCTHLSSAITKCDLETLENMLEETLGKGEMDANETNTGCVLEPNMVCHHGNVAFNGLCKCQTAWVTTTDDEVYQPSLLQYHMCNVEVGAWNCVNKGKIKTTALLIAIFAVTIATKILILMCILNWCYKHFRPKKKTCGRDLDPFDESLLLCDTLDSFEQCICTEPPSQKNKIDGLKSETVNVSFYPCCPSGFSSVHVSSGSAKSAKSTKSVKSEKLVMSEKSLRDKRTKSSFKSDPSILLSVTTSTSAPVSFESETDASSDDSDEDDDDDDDYDIEFVGEGEEEEDECVCGEEEDGNEVAGDPSGTGQDEVSEYTASSASRKFTSSSKSKSRSTSQKSLSFKKSQY